MENYQHGAAIRDDCPVATYKSQTLYTGVEVLEDNIQSPLQLTITSQYISIHSFLITASVRPTVSDEAVIFVLPLQFDYFFV